MARRTSRVEDGGMSAEGVENMPSSVTDIEPIVKEFQDKLKTVKQEQELLKQDEKDLFDEYSKKLDMKTLKAALRAVAIREKVEHKDTFDTLCTVLERAAE
jgi:Sec-independent protein translocase protein TatA